jgi:hypothetical protein
MKENLKTYPVDFLKADGKIETRRVTVPQNEPEKEKTYIFRTNTGAAVFCTYRQFEKNWKDMILSKGMTYTAEEVSPEAL